MIVWFEIRRSPMSLRHGLRMLAIVILTVGFADAQTIPPATAKRIDEIVAKAITEQQIPAISVSIALNGQMQYQKAFGKADLENNVSPTPETRFRTRSISKPLS